MRFYNTRTSRLEPFKPLHDNKVTLYTCGPTVYSEPLVGNWVAYIRWDLLVRTLRAFDYTVDRVMNITDVGHLVSDADEGEDKMSKGARREGVTEWEVADRYTNSFIRGMNALNLIPPEHLSKATDHISEQIDLIKQLESKGFTYTIDDGVYFDSSRFPTYADFAHLDVDAQKAGARVAYNTKKRNSSDFVLWRLSKTSEHRAMEWDSPWGHGIPGWHIECSAMAMKYLGETIDIHTGGIDHIPVHHTNEIAQSEAVSGKLFANVWLHANFLLVNGTKISKSLGNGYTLDDIESKGYGALDFKMFVLQSHYRTESNFTWDNVDAAANRLKRWRAAAAMRHQITSTTQPDVMPQNLSAVIAEAREALGDDLGSPQALVIIENAFDTLEKSGAHKDSSREIADFFRAVDSMLGLDLCSSTPNIDEHVQHLMDEREHARTTKDWHESDRLRDELTKKGVGILDTAHGPRWFYL